MEIRTSEQLNKLSQAMLAAQMKIENADLDSSNPHFKSKYASLTAVLDACKRPLNEAGIYFIQAPVACPSGKDCLGMVTRLTHAESGQWLEATMSMPLQKVDPQGVGSAITYARRYSLMAILGMAAEDDDAEAAMQRGPQAHNAPPAARQAPPSRQAAPSQPANSDGLPAFAGVRYIHREIDGRPCIVADGKVFPVKDQLKKAGFRFDQATKSWFIIDESMPDPDEFWNDEEYAHYDGGADY